jgi:hypothetical protein
VYPYLAAELNIKQQRQQLARAAEHHRMTHSDRPRPVSATTQRSAPRPWLRRWIRPALTPAP